MVGALGRDTRSAFSLSPFFHFSTTKNSNVMTKKKHTPQGELSYYGLSLLSYLRDSHPDLAADDAFIAGRADRAAEVYSDSIKSGLTHIEAEELAGAELYRGLHFSPYNPLLNIRWEEFSAEIPEDDATATARKLLPHCAGVLAKYQLSDDFTATAEYDLFYTELTGTVQILLEDGTV